MSRKFSTGETVILSHSVVHGPQPKYPEPMRSVLIVTGYVERQNKQVLDVLCIDGQIREIADTDDIV